MSLRCGVAGERSKVQWLWVPAFAGTTADSSALRTVEEVSQALSRGRQPRAWRQSAMTKTIRFIAAASAALVVHHPRARRRDQPRADRQGQAGRPGHLLHRSHRRSDRAAAHLRVRGEVRHQGRVHARRQPGEQHQAAQRISRRPRDRGRVRAHLRHGGADRGGRCPAIHRRQCRGAAAAISRPGPLLGLLASVRAHPGPQHQPGAGCAAAEELRRPAPPVLEGPHGLEDERPLGRSGLHRQRAHPHGRGARHGLPAQARHARTSRCSTPAPAPCSTR